MGTVGKRLCKGTKWQIKFSLRLNIYCIYLVRKEEMILKKMFSVYGALMVLGTKVYSSEKSVKLLNLYKQFENMLLNYSELRKGTKEEMRQGTIETKRDMNMKWAYRGRTSYEFWSALYPECGGSRQSPINIDTSLVTSRDDIPRLHLHHYRQVTEANTILVNNGRTLELHLIEFRGKQPTLFGGRLDGKFTLTGAHFHWGATSSLGSEHTINRKRFPMDLHLVHRSKNGKGLAVIAFQFEVSSEYNQALSPITDQAEYLVQAGFTSSAQTGFRYFSLWSLISPVLAHSGYFTYLGSLTTPPCSESVTWIVFREPLPASEFQLESFRLLWDENGDRIVNNFRNVQHLSNRTVLYSDNI